MSIIQYNNTCFNQFVDYNDENVHLLAENLFEKIRQTGILPNYIDRDKDTRIKADVDFISSGYTQHTDSDFTFGISIDGYTASNSTTNIPAVCTISFELKIPSSVTIDFLLFDNQIRFNYDRVIFYCENDGVNPVPYHSLLHNLVDGGFYKIKIIRNNNHFTIYANNILVLSTYVTILTPIADFGSIIYPNTTTYLGNFLILSNENKILNWWKFNFIGSDLNSWDRGDGDYDFYSFWYSYCFTIALINKYREILGAVNNNDYILEKFIQSKGIAV